MSVVQIWVPSNPRGAEMLTPGIIAPESDYYLRRLWGKPEEVRQCLAFNLLDNNLFIWVYSHFLAFFRMCL